MESDDRDGDGLARRAVDWIISVAHFCGVLLDFFLASLLVLGLMAIFLLACWALYTHGLFQR